MCQREVLKHRKRMTCSWAAPIATRYPWGAGYRGQNRGVARSGGSGRRQRQNAFEERDNAFLPLLSPGKQTSSRVCLTCWSAKVVVHSTYRRSREVPAGL
jgi:hypothetical protein